MSDGMVVNVWGVECSRIYIGCLPSYCFCDRHAYHHQDHLPSQLDLRSNLRLVQIFDILQYHVRSFLRFHQPLVLLIATESFDRQQRHAGATTSAAVLPKPYQHRRR
jgi:hypothetical protein